MLRIADQIAALNEGQLNEGNRRETAAFSEFRGQLGITLLLTIVLGLGLAAFSMTRILRLEYLSRERFLEITKARGELKELSARLVETQENERRAISRELHDQVGQSLSAVLVELGNLAKAIRGSEDPRPREHIDSIRKLVEECVGVVRNMALLLRPSMLDDFGLVPALEWQAREVSRRTGIRVKVAVEDVSGELPESHRTCIYRIVQEALHNCSRHAEARLVRITVRQQPDKLTLSIQDDGKGFDAQNTRGLGLLGMQERVTYLGGEFDVQSEPGGGALLSVELPLTQQSLAAAPIA
jgi:signal transduction histidine kinase